MKKISRRGPQDSALFRTVAFFSRLQLRYLLQNVGNPQVLVVVFVFVAGTSALAIITVAAYLTKLPLLFPPLGPSAFILFHTPMSISASPRNVILSHTMAVVAGLLWLKLAGWIFPEANLNDPSVLNWYRVAAIALSMGLIGILMVSLKCVHPPAAASALIAAMGFLTDLIQVIGLIAAVVLLVMDAFFLNRVLGGLPYPIWHADPQISRSYGVLAGIPDTETTFWQQMAAKIFQRR